MDLAVGVKEGEAVGFADGLRDGLKEDLTDETNDGKMVGMQVDLKVEAIGALELMMDGEVVEATIGLPDGTTEFFNEGAIDGNKALEGMTDGLTDGLTEGAIDGKEVVLAVDFVLLEDGEAVGFAEGTSAARLSNVLAGGTSATA